MLWGNNAPLPGLLQNIELRGIEKPVAHAFPDAMMLAASANKKQDSFLAFMPQLCFFCCRCLVNREHDWLI